MSGLGASGFSFTQVQRPAVAAPSSAAPLASASSARAENLLRRAFPSLFAASLAVHALIAVRLSAGATEHAVRPPSKVEIEVVRPRVPPPPPVPVVIPPPADPPPQAKRQVHPAAVAPVPKSVTSPPPASMAGVPEGDEGTLPPAPAIDPQPAIGAPTAPPVAAAPAPPPPAPAVVAAKEGANYLKNPRPAYPRIAKREGWQGLVTLRVRVLPNGRPEGVAVQGSSGRAVLDEAAIEAVKGWTFVPASQGGQAIAGWVTVPIDFRLQ